jgi:hypothetical protein
VLVIRVDIGHENPRTNHGQDFYSDPTEEENIPWETRLYRRGKVLTAEVKFGAIGGTKIVKMAKNAGSPPLQGPSGT